MPLLQIKNGEFSTEKGITYLETKHFLLMFYCQCITFYILLKAQGRSVKNHPVIAQMIEIRMFLEKVKLYLYKLAYIFREFWLITSFLWQIRPIDKKLQYQIEKLLKMAKTPFDTSKNDGIVGSNDDDLLFKPNPDMLVSKIDQTEKVDDTHCFQCIIEWMF